jgi:hypothetical protein
MQPWLKLRLNKALVGYKFAKWAPLTDSTQVRFSLSGENAALKAVGKPRRADARWAAGSPGLTARVLP